MSDAGRESLGVLVFSTSRRAESINAQLASLAATVLERLGASVDVAMMREFDAPSYDGDVEAVDGFPAAVTRQCDGCMASHARGAARRGATAAEVADAFGVAILMNGGPGTVHAPRAFEAFQEFVG